MGIYDSTYAVFTNPTDWAGLGSPAFSVALRLGDNSGGSTGLAELVLNGASGQLAWGTNGSGNLDSDANFPSPDFVDVEFDVPISTSPTQSPAILTVGGAPDVQYSGAPAYSAVANVLVEAFVSTGGSPTACVSVIWGGLSVTFFDADNNATTNPSAGTNPIASQGTGCPGGQSNVKALLATPGFSAVRVHVKGSIRLISTDTHYQNYGANLSATSLQGKIYVWAS